MLGDWTGESEEVARQDEKIEIASCPQSIATPTRDRTRPLAHTPKEGSVTEPLPPGPDLSGACQDGLSESNSIAVPCLSRKGEILQSAFRSNPPCNTVEAIFIFLHAELIYRGFEADSNEGRVLSRDFPSNGLYQMEYIYKGVMERKDKVGVVDEGVAEEGVSQQRCKIVCTAMGSTCILHGKLRERLAETACTCVCLCR